MSSDKIVEQIVEILVKKIVSEIKVELDFEAKRSDKWSNVEEQLRSV